MTQSISIKRFAMAFALVAGLAAMSACQSSSDSNKKAATPSSVVTPNQNGGGGTGEAGGPDQKFRAGHDLRSCPEVGGTYVSRDQRQTREFMRARQNGSVIYRMGVEMIPMAADGEFHQGQGDWGYQARCAKGAFQVRVLKGTQLMQVMSWAPINQRGDLIQRVRADRSQLAETIWIRKGRYDRQQR